MSDLIDRQVAIDAICMEWCGVKHQNCKHPFDVEKDDYYWCDGCETALRTLPDLPAAEPERKKGKWIPHKEKSREYIGTVLVSVEYDYWLCDACGYRVENGQPMYNFCPYCGADMGGDMRMMGKSAHKALDNYWSWIDGYLRGKQNG